MYVSVAFLRVDLHQNHSISVIQATYSTVSGEDKLVMGYQVDYQVGYQAVSIVKCYD
jgi:hypoxanthine-guanine phosphoribosyltransferase